MSERTKDWLKGSFSSWAAAVMLAVFSYLGKELHHDVKMLQATMSMDRQKASENAATINSSLVLLKAETKGEMALLSSETKAEIAQLKYKLDMLTRAVGDIKKPQ